MCKDVDFGGFFIPVNCLSHTVSLVPSFLTFLGSSGRWSGQCCKVQQLQDNELLKRQES